MFGKRFYSDAETTGTFYWVNALIQFSAVIFIEGKEMGRIDLAIQPFPDDVIEDTALEVNGVTREELFSEDRLTPQEAYQQIIAFVSQWCDKFDKTDKYFWHGFRAQFDADFLREFFYKCGDTYFGSWFWVPVNDVMHLAGYILMRERHKLVNFKLRTVFEFLYPNRRYSEEEWHDSTFDILRTLDIEEALRRRLYPTSR